MRKAVYYTLMVCFLLGGITSSLILSGCAAGGGGGGTTIDPTSPETPGETYFIFVDITNGSDAAAGTKSDPVDDINEGITVAESAGEDVCVAEGTYEVDYSSATHIVMVEGVSIYGGYRNTDGVWVRDISSYTTTITDISTGPDVSNQAITVGSGITTDTKIDGFTINGGGGDSSTGIYFSGGSPTVSNNTVNGGSGTTTSGALRVYSSATPDIIQNTINGGSGGSTSYGILCSSSNPYISNNTISGGSGSNSRGVNTVESSPTIENNIIDTGTGSSGLMAIAVGFDSTPAITGNTLRSSGSVVRFGINEFADTSEPQSVINNIFSSTLSVLYNDCTGGFNRNMLTIDDLNALDENSYNPTGTVYGNTYLEE
jgi:hypothetical protein